MAEREKNKRKQRAAGSAALCVYVCFFFLGTGGLVVGSLGAPLEKGLRIFLEINKIIRTHSPRGKFGSDYIGLAYAALFDAM